MRGLGIGIGIDSVSGGGIPFRSDALFWLDGTILYSAPNYYFVDKISGKNFLITGYDFDTTWTKGFPYKSAATISAPAGDAALISADLNSILYTSGTPNQIPVISLFQNMDYKDRMFCRHEAQVVDGNGVETFEPRVKDIVLYANAKSSADLTKCQTYYGVPAIVAGAKFIDPVNGVDATGNGTQALPYKTVSKVNGLTLTEGTQVYILTGQIAPIAISKNYNYKGIGRVKIQNVSGSRGIDWDPQAAKTLTQTIEGLWIDMNSVAASVGINANPTGYSLILNKIYYSNNVGTAHTNRSVSAVTVKSKNSIYTASVVNVIYNQVSEIDTCYIKESAGVFMWAGNSVANSHITVKNCNINAITTNFCNLYKALNFTFIGNKYNNSAALLSQSNANANAGVITIYGNTMNSTINKGIIDWKIAGYSIYCNNNTIDYKESTTTLIELEGYINEANNNIINSEGGGTLLFFNNSLSHEKTVKANNNRLINKNKDTGYLLVGGKESSNPRDNKITYLEFKNNYLDGYYNYGSESSGTHGLFCGFVKQHDIRFNNSNANYIGLVIKGGTNAENICAYNVIKNNSIGVWWKDAVYSNFINNTILGSGENYRMTENLDTNIGCSNMVIKNNFLQANAIIITDSTGVFDYNIYKTGVQINSNSFTVFKGLGNETNGREETIAFNDIIPNTPVSDGEDLGDSYDDGLDASTNWGSDSQLPVVVTKQQGASWDIGAYVH